MFHLRHFIECHPNGTAWIHFRGEVIECRSRRNALERVRKMFCGKK